MEPRNHEGHMKDKGREEVRATGDDSKITTESSFGVKVHNDTSDRLSDEILKWILNQNSSFSINHVTSDKPSVSNVSSTTLYSLKFDKISPQTGEIDKILDDLKNKWCDFVLAKGYRHLWLEIERPTVSSEALSSPKHKLKVISMSLGSFPSYGKYCHHWSSEPSCLELEITVCFEYDLEIATIQYVDKRRGKWKLDTSFDHLDKLIVVTATENHVYLYQKKPFKILLAKKSRPYLPEYPSDVIDSEEPTETEFLWQRQIQFGDCPTQIVGSSNVIQLQLGKDESSLNDVLSRFAKLDFSIVAGNPLLEDAKVNEPIVCPEFNSFRLSYAWFCLMSHGFKVTDQVTQKFAEILTNSQEEFWVEETLKAVTRAFDNASICDLEKQFQKDSERIMSRERLLSDELRAEIDEPPVPHVVSIRRLVLTPTSIKGFGEEWTVENRVLREFGYDRFVRVSIRDDDFSRLTSYIPIQEIKRRIVDFLTNGFEIGARRYRFLGCSNSQLRSHSVWMYASDGKGETVDSIREWMGDVSHERCVATYVSRLGQCFTSSRNTVEVKNIEWIDDISRNTKYCFTDGIGRISAPLARRVAKALNLRYTPSAFQIRFGGCKGVVALAPDLGEEETMQLRKSMKKFSSKHNQLEVVEMTRPVHLYLNRQAMLLMAGLGVSDESFFKLQDRMLVNMADILLDEEIAAKEIAKAHLGIEWKQLKDSGIVITTEPFLREVLATIYHQRFNDLLSRTHIEIPEDKGRMMMGTVDEFDCLEYGEVFVQFSKNIDNPNQEVETLNRSVIVTKSPCFHPGDMRKFKAVDKVELHHMVDCIVFPAKGPRPHPNEMSGSDLDGDLYFVCWEDSLIPPHENKQAMDFTPQVKQVLNRHVTESDMIQFLGRYIDSDQLGVIANAHLVHADSTGVNCSDCLEIAQIHSNAVDFPKTGQVQRLPKDLRPSSYPDYMMKTDKPSYTSITVIGKLFQQCRTIEHSNEFRKFEQIVLDPDFILPGHETYLERANAIKATYVKAMDDLMAMYGIETEVELLSVGTFSFQKRVRHLKGDHYAIAEVLKLRLDVIKEKITNMFYEEFGGTKRKHFPAPLQLKASALYRISYDILEDNDLDQLAKNPTVMEQSENDARRDDPKVTEQGQKQLNRHCLGLPWIFWDLLCMIKKQKSSDLKHEMEELIFRPTSFLQKISLEIASFKITGHDEDWKKRRVELLCRLRGFVASSVNAIKLIPFGSSITNCANSVSSLNTFVETDSFQSANQFQEKSERFKEIAKILANQVGGELLKSTRSKSVNKLTISNIPDTAMNITLFSDNKCLLRTSYIAAATALNKWAIPVLRVVLAWGRNTGISSIFGDSLLSEEELAIIFFHFTILKYGRTMSEDILKRSHKLLMENHFQTCHLEECTHIEMNVTATSECMLTNEFEELSIKTVPADIGRKTCAVKRDEVIVYGKAILGFFYFYGVVRGLALKEVPDPDRVNSRSFLLKFKDPEYIQIGEQMMEAYHSLANCSTIDDFLQPNCQEHRHFTMVLPNEVSSIFKYVETGWEETLMQDTGVSFVNIRMKRFRWMKPGHVIEAWGNVEAIRRLKVKIHRIIGSAVCYTLGNFPRDRWSISGAYRTVFEGATGPESYLSICRYNRRCQNWHRKSKKQIPVLINFDPSDAYTAEKVASYFEEQRDFLRKNYNFSVHGGIRVAVSFGNYYTLDLHLGLMKVGQLSQRLSGSPSVGKAEHVRNNQATATSRLDTGLHVRPNEGLHAYFGAQRNYNINVTSLHPRDQRVNWNNPSFRNPWNSCAPESANRKRISAFIPSNGLDLKRVMDFLKRHNFVETEHRCEYRPTIKMSGSDGIIVLNKNFRLTMFHLQDIMWFVLNVSRRKTDWNSQATESDIRIKIHSRPVITAEELAKRLGCQDLLENAHRLLHRNSAGEVDGIALDEYKGRIKYMRYKDMTSFRFQGKPRSRRDDEQDIFLNRVTFKLNRGKEYRSPTKDGIFTEITDQTELILETELPDLEDKEECEEFMREIYEFSKDIAQRLVDQLR